MALVHTFEIAIHLIDRLDITMNLKFYKYSTDFLLLFDIRVEQLLWSNLENRVMINISNISKAPSHSTYSIFAFSCCEFEIKNLFQIFYIKNFCFSYTYISWVEGFDLKTFLSYIKSEMNFHWKNDIMKYMLKRFV